MRSIITTSAHMHVLFCLHSLAVLMTSVNIYSVKLAARLMTALSSLKLIALAAIVVLGAWHFIRKGECIGFQL